LTAVLEDAAQLGCTDYICMGDIVGYNADPVACLQRVQDLGCPVIRGNHDDDASTDHSLESMNPVAATALEWTRDQLSEEQKDYLRRLRMVRQIEDFTVVHSTLDQPSNWNYVTNRFDAMSNFSYQFTQVCFHGHTHVPRVYAKKSKVAELPPESLVIEPDTKYFVNVGSAGQPRDGDWRACYAIYDLDEKLVIFRRVEYDIETTQRKIHDADLPAMLAERLADGR
jgi:diadenosine tetraphosphatase ApaH/serine/threonine PP2A family protein phosphatase